MSEILGLPDYMKDIKDFNEKYTTLKDETLEILKDNGKTFEDVIFITDGINEISKEDFLRLSNKKYYDGYGFQIVNEGLMLVGENWWLERDEYDGSEWWKFKTIPKRPKNINNNPKIFCYQ